MDWKTKKLKYAERRLLARAEREHILKVYDFVRLRDREAISKINNTIYDADVFWEYVEEIEGGTGPVDESVFDRLVVADGDLPNVGFRIPISTKAGQKSGWQFYFRRPAGETRLDFVSVSQAIE